MKYLRVFIENVEPLCVSDDSTSQSGQTDSCRYIPGTTIRGFTINALSENEELFLKYKRFLFTDKVCFLNGYPCSEEEGSLRELMPSLKGFYEDKKADGSIQNVVIDGVFDEGKKRAALGRFCSINGSTLDYYNISTDSVLKIRINDGDQKVFRSEYVLPGYMFASYVAIDDEVPEELIGCIKSVLNDRSVILGNGRSQGFGKCCVKAEECDYPAVWDTSIRGDFSSGYAYMILLSNTVMRNDKGEYCGIDTKELETALGIQSVVIDHCATSVVNVHGYNSTWGTKLPTVPMYERGSVFKLSFNGCLSPEKLKYVFDNGIGERKEEGFGRVLIIDDSYEKINSKCEKSICSTDRAVAKEVSGKDREVLKIIAKKYYRILINNAIEKKLPEDVKKIRINKSQSGTVLSILEKNQFDPKADIVTIIKDYFEHAGQKEENQRVHKDRVSIKDFSKEINRLLTCNIIKDLGINNESIMGINTEELLKPEDIRRLAVSYVVDVIKYAGKEKS